MFDRPLVTPEDIETLVRPDAKVALKYVYDAISLTRHKLEGKVPLIGFTGAPWTLMSYMIEGGGSKTQSKAKKWLYQYPEASRKLLALITEVNVDYLVEQVRAGAQLLQVFESNAEYHRQGRPLRTAEAGGLWLRHRWNRLDHRSVAG